jgi:hypothetical protein
LFFTLGFGLHPVRGLTIAWLLAIQYIPEFLMKACFLLIHSVVVVYCIQIKSPGFTRDNGQTKFFNRPFSLENEVKLLPGPAKFSHMDEIKKLLNLPTKYFIVFLPIDLAYSDIDESNSSYYNFVSPTHILKRKFFYE